ncbi:hypothetical protein D3C83_111350 [compost metagenome]
MRGRKLLAGAPDRACARRVHGRELVLENAAPLEIRTVERAAQRVEHQQLQAVADVFGNRFVLEAGDEIRDAAGVGIVLFRFACHLSVPV